MRESQTDSIKITTETKPRQMTDSKNQYKTPQKTDAFSPKQKRTETINLILKSRL